MAERVLTLRELNRATLARQMLLEREVILIPAALERLAGMQAQLASAPYVGLWTRLKDFQRNDLARLIEDHGVVKATMMRATLHLVTASDYVKFRATLQEVLAQAAASISKSRGVELEIKQVLETARAFIAEAPRSFAEITAMFEQTYPGVDVGALRYTTRTHLPLVQVPTQTQWSYPGNPQFTLADRWLGQPIPDELCLRELILRYLAALGPATVSDMQTWSGLQKLKDTFEALRPELVTYRDERKRELFDVPDMPIPDADTPAPERFLPEFDNILLSHDKRTRIVADEHRKRVYLPGLRVAATILVDGFVRGAWKIETKKGTATLTITPFTALSDANTRALVEEGEKLVRLAASEAKAFEVRFADG
ncbi:MAG: winged helix DNA-binding domain-containing protein [Chloroflexota bacterium]